MPVRHNQARSKARRNRGLCGKFFTSTRGPATAGSIRWRRARGANDHGLSIVAGARGRQIEQFAPCYLRTDGRRVESGYSSEILHIRIAPALINWQTACSFSSKLKRYMSTANIGEHSRSLPGAATPPAASLRTNCRHAASLVSGACKRGCLDQFHTKILRNPSLLRASASPREISEKRHAAQTSAIGRRQPMRSDLFSWRPPRSRASAEGWRPARRDRRCRAAVRSRA